MQRARVPLTLTVDDISGLTIADSVLSYSGDGRRLRLALQACALGNAYEFDPYFGLSISRVDPLPHQLEAVYDHLLELPSVRFLRIARRADFAIDGAEFELYREITRFVKSLLGETVKGTPVADCIDEFLKCAELDGESGIKRHEKAFAHAFLATRPDPHVSLGHAAQRGYWDLDHPALEGVRSFLSDLAQYHRPSGQEGAGP